MTIKRKKNYDIRHTDQYDMYFGCSTREVLYALICIEYWSVYIDCI